jgi:hypothetical protein
VARRSAEGEPGFRDRLLTEVDKANIALIVAAERR